MLLNIKFKGPFDESWVLKYDKNLASHKVVQTISRFHIRYKTIVAFMRLSILDSILLASQSLFHPRNHSLFHFEQKKLARKLLLNWAQHVTTLISITETS